MSERYIIFPKPAEFRDSYTKEIIKVADGKGGVEDHPDREFAWFMHVYMLSHLQFSMEVGGYDAVKASKKIAKDMEKALDENKPFFGVSGNSWKRLNCCTLRADDKDADELLKDKPNPGILAKSSRGMTRKMDNFTALCFMDHMDAIQNASTNEPEIEKGPE